ncbi:MAG TPA: hypothetical protein PKA10_18350 [Selenomonadales bacterium]|nr:hypothetical protein [Selenomonadales bacterium]
MATLSRAGHTFSEIKTYTLAQMLLFYGVALRQRIDYMQDVRSAIWADGKELGKYIDEITKQ